MKWVLLLAPFLMLSCATTKDYGAGPCKEYTPMCLGGQLVCEHDKRGCEVCTCVSDDGAMHGPHIPPGQDVPTGAEGPP